MDTIQPPTISSSGTRYHPENPPHFRCHGNHRRDRNTIWRVFLRTQDSESSGTYLSLISIRNWVRDGRNACLVTGWIRGTWPGSNMAYAAPLKVVPISRATTSFRERSEYGVRAVNIITQVKKAMDKVRRTLDFECVPEIRHTFLLHNSVKAHPDQKPRHKDAGHTSLLVPSRTSETYSVSTHLPFTPRVKNICSTFFSLDGTSGYARFAAW